MSSNTVKQRISFASTKNQLQYPDFLEVQLKSFKDFFQLGTTPENRKNEGLYTVFRRTSQSPTPETILFWNFWTTSSIRPVIR